jgi:pimeloyl-ACP methyl ester carboxylesterase
MATLLVLILLVACVVAGLVWFTARTARRVEAALPPHGGFMDIDGQRIHYVDMGGSGPAIVMIHGLGGNLLNFSYAMADRLAGDFRVILVDRPGSGYSTRPANASATLTAQASTLAALFRRLGLQRPLLVGHSLGGALSLAIALDHPDCASALILIAPLTHAVEEVHDVFKGLMVGSPLLRRIIAWTVATPMSIRQGPKVMQAVFAPEAAPSDFPLRGGGLLGLRPSAFYGASSDIVAINAVLPGYTARYQSLNVPIAILYGRGDNLLDYRDQGEAMKAKLPALELELMEGGHMLPVTAPDRCAALVRRVADKLKHDPEKRESVFRKDHA